MITKLNGVENLNKTDLRGMSRNDVLRLLQVLGEWKTDDDKDTVYRTEIERMSSESGSQSVQDFIIRLGYFPNPSVKKTRTVIPKDVRPKIVEDLRLGTLTNQEVSKKYGVTVDVIYSIRKKNGLSTPRTKKVPTTTTVTVPTPTTTNPTTVPTPTVTVSPTTVSESEKTLTPSVV